MEFSDLLGNKLKSIGQILSSAHCPRRIDHTGTKPYS